MKFFLAMFKQEDKGEAKNEENYFERLPIEITTQTILSKLERKDLFHLEQTNHFFKTALEVPTLKQELDKFKRKKWEHFPAHIEKVKINLPNNWPAEGESKHNITIIFTDGTRKNKKVERYEMGRYLGFFGPSSVATFKFIAAGGPASYLDVNGPQKSGGIDFDVPSSYSDSDDEYDAPPISPKFCRLS